MSDMIERGATFLLNQQRELDEVPVDDLSRGVLFAALDPEDDGTGDVCAAILRDKGLVDLTVVEAQRCVRVVINALRSCVAQARPETRKAADT